MLTAVRNFGMYNVPRCRNGKGESSWAARLSEAGDSLRVTPLAFIHRCFRPLDGWMVVANPYHHTGSKLDYT